MENIYTPSKGAASRTALPPGLDKAVTEFQQLHHPGVDNATKTLVYEYFQEKANSSGNQAKELSKEMDKIKTTLKTTSQARLADILTKLKEEDKQFTFFASTSFIRNSIFNMTVNRVMQGYGVDQNFPVPIMGGTFGDLLYDKFKEKYLLPEERNDPITRLQGHKTVKVNDEPSEEGPSPTQPTTVNAEDENSSGLDITYYRFGDILSSFIESGVSGDSYVKMVMEQERLKYVLGNITIAKASITGRPTEDEIVSIYDIPVEHFEFMKMIQKTFTGTERTHVNATMFIKGLFGIVKEFFLTANAALDPGLINKFVLRSNQIITEKQIKSSDLASSSAIKKLNLADSRISIKEGQKDSLNRYMIFNAADHPSSISQAGLDFYFIGAAESIVKKISFQETQDDIKQAWIDQNIVNSYMDSNAQILPQMYDVRMDVVGNVRFFPGYTFILHPFIQGMTQLQAQDIHDRLGLSGVYISHAIEHTISQAGFNTSITKSFNVTAGKKAARLPKNVAE